MPDKLNEKLDCPFFIFFYKTNFDYFYIVLFRTLRTRYFAATCTKRRKESANDFNI